ncbi:MAG: glycosyltransferase [Xanthomonadaceae bacterium]|nr:glycosyltransferase [Xanthomonadaceae bacterium]
MDIAHVVENLERGGLERMVIDLAVAQRAAGHRPRVACLFEPGALAGELEGQGIEVFACRKQGGLDLRAVRRLRDWLAATPGTVVHTHNANAHYHTVAASFGRAPARLVNTRHGMGASRPRSRGEWLYRRSMWRTDTVAAVCEAARARFAAQGVRPRSALISVPNGIRVETFVAANEERRTALRNVLGLAPGTRIIGTVGRLNPVKDQAMLLRAFARVHAEAADTALLLVGDGALRMELEAQAMAGGAGDAVHFLGDRGDVRQLLQGFDVFALSSRSEGYSMALLEACASGLPIVATDVGGNREIVRHDANGALVPAADEQAMSTALLGLLRDPARAQRLGGAGRAWALREASVQAMATRYDALYRGGSP